MDLALASQPSRWRCLIWKDFHQVKSLVLAVILGHLVLQGGLAVWRLGSSLAGAELNTLSMPISLSIPIWIWVAPVLIALGCGGMLIGHERQTGTWNWQSSLPVSWMESLASKMIVTIGSAIVSAVCLSVLPIFLWATNRLQIDNQSWIVTYASLLSLIVFFEIIFFGFLASLLIRETLTALVTAGLILTFSQLISVAILGPYGSSDQELMMLQLGGGALLLLGGVTMVLAYRWRWSSGQLAQWASWRQASDQAAPPIRAHFYSEIHSPSQWRTLFTHALRNSLGLRLTTFFGSMFLELMIISHPPGQETAAIIVLIATAVFGLTTFEADRNMGRFRFLADRGVHPSKLVMSRLLGAGVWAMSILLLSSMMFPLYDLPNNETWTFACLLPLAFLLPTLVSMAFDRPIIAGLMSIVLAIGGLTLYAVSLERIYTASGEIVGQFYYLAPVHWMILLVAIFGYARRWIVLDDSRVTLFAFATAFFVAVLPSLLLLILY